MDSSSTSVDATMSDRTCSKCQSTREKMKRLAENVMKSRSETQKVVSKLHEVINRCKLLQKQNIALKKDREKLKETIANGQTNASSDGKNVEAPDSSTIVNDDIIQKLQAKCDAQVAENTTLVSKLREIVKKFKTHKDEFSRCKISEEKEKEKNRLLRKKYDDLLARHERTLKGFKETASANESAAVRSMAEAKDAAVAELEDAKSRLKDAQTKGQSLAKQYKVLAGKAKSIQEIAAREKEGRASLESRVRELETSLADASKSSSSLTSKHAEEVTSLRREHEEALKRLTETASANESANSKIQRSQFLKMEERSKRTHADRIRRMREETASKISSVREQFVTEKCAAREAVEGKIAEIVALQKREEMNVAAHEASLQSVSNSESEMRRKLEELELRSAATLESERCLRDELKHSRLELSKSVESRQSLTKKLKDGWEQYEKLKAKVSSLSHNREADEEASSARDQLKIQEDLVVKLKDRLRSQMGNMDTLRERVEELQDENNEAGSTFRQELETLTSSIEKQNDENQRLVRLLGQKNSNYKIEKSRLEEEKRSVEAELRFLTKKYQDEQSKFVEVDKMRHRLRSLDEQRKDHIADLTKTDLSIIREVKAEKEEEISALRSSINKERQRVEQFKQKLRDVVSMCSKYKEQNVALKQNCADAQRQIEIGKTQIIQLSNLVSRMH